MEYKLQFKNIATEYKNHLQRNILPFWEKYGIDTIHGGIYTGLDRDGSLLESDKSVWFQGRALWTFASAIELFDSHDDFLSEKRLSYLQACEHLVHFIEEYCTDSSDGRMYFRLTKDGKPVIKRIRYFFSETFALIGFAVYARVTNNKDYAYKAIDLFQKIEKIRASNDILTPKFNQDTIPTRGFGVPMILLNTISELKKTISYFALQDITVSIKVLDEYIHDLITEIKTYFIRSDLKVVLEQCAVDGSIQDEHFEGRLLNPGHAIEGAWFMMKEGLQQNNKDIQNMGLSMLDWMWERGWDKEYGGIIYYRDLHNKSATEYWHDMKFWWPQNEAVIANLYAYFITKNKIYFDRFLEVHTYFENKFCDKKFGECFGYFHRDGTLSTPLKGNMYKGPFHIPRMYMECYALLQKLL